MHALIGIDLGTTGVQAAMHDVRPTDVQGVGRSGQMHGVVLLDEKEQVLRPCIIWADQRSDAQCRWMTERVGAESLIAYVSNPALPGFSAPKALWVRDNIGLPERALERWTGLDAYELLIKEAEQIAPGCDGLFFSPYLQGERTPHLDPLARGGWTGLTASHDRRHLIRAVLEGAAFSLKDCFAILREQGLRLEQVRATGGGAKSPLWRHILADVLGVELVTTANADEGPAFGAALLAGVASGIYRSIQQACDSTIRLVEHTEPRPEVERVYARRYETYRTLYPALKPILKLKSEREWRSCT